jgi:hypothetical protein
VPFPLAYSGCFVSLVTVTIAIVTFSGGYILLPYDGVNKWEEVEVMAAI